jgi:hypothetical protein
MALRIILCAKPVAASDEILKPLFSKHVLVAVSSFSDAIRANRDHLTRAQPGAGRDRISSGLRLNYFRMHSQIYNPSKFFRMFSSGIIRHEVQNFDGVKILNICHCAIHKCNFDN